MSRNPKLPGLLGEMFTNLQQSGISADLINLQLIAFASLLTQGVADSDGPMGLTPIGVSCCGVHPSGAGKSSIFKELMRPIDEELDAVSDPMSGFLLEDATREAIVESMKDCPTAGIFTDEGGQLESLLGTSAPTIVKLLDGNGPRHARITNKRSGQGELRVCITNPRLTALALVQPEIFERLKPKFGVGQGGQGLANRFIWDDAPASRMLQSGNLGLSEQVRCAYSLKIKTLLQMTADHSLDRSKKFPVIRLSSNAERHLRSLKDRQFFGVPHEYATRHAQRVLRMAGAFHVFENGPIGEISDEYLYIAEDFDRLSIEAFERLIYVPPKLTQTERDAETLIRAFSEFAPNARLDLKGLRRYAPNVGLTKGRVDRALPLVCREGFASVYVHDGIEYVQLMPRPRGNYWNRGLA